jgi:hypothetical protein
MFGSGFCMIDAYSSGWVIDRTDHLLWNEASMKIIFLKEDGRMNNLVISIYFFFLV